VEGRLKQLKQHKTDMDKAKNVAIIGGGVTAVEMVAEILTATPLKKIDWYISQDTLLANANDKVVSDKTERFFAKFANLTIKRGPRIDLTDPMLALYDLVLPVTGLVPNTQFLCGTFIAGARDKRGFITTTIGKQGYPSGVVVGVAKQNILAIGDLISPLVQSGYQAGESAKIHAKNLSKYTPLFSSISRLRQKKNATDCLESLANTTEVE
jgi:pyruvate/2-oxoglutarate dehydrogenase complex dihydrolipoamide dehydrogenase (E3) component